MAIQLDVDQLTVTSFATATEPSYKLEPWESYPAICTCIGICETDDTCIAMGCQQDPFTVDGVE